MKTQNNYRRKKSSRTRDLGFSQPGGGNRNEDHSTLPTHPSKDGYHSFQQQQRHQTISCRQITCNQRWKGKVEIQAGIQV